MPLNHKELTEATDPTPKNKPRPEEVVDEITAWWQKALGKKAVLGQASNRPPPGPRAPIPKLLWIKSESEHAQQETTAVAATPASTEKKGTNHSETRERKGRHGLNTRLTALGQLKYWSGVMVSGTVLFLAVVLLRFAVAVFETVRAALGLLTLAFKEVKRWPHRLMGLLLRTNPLPEEANQ